MAHKGAARGRREAGERGGGQAEIPLLLDVGAALGARWTRGGHGATVARGRGLGKLVLGALAGVLRRLEGAPLHPREGHGLARAVRRRLVRSVRIAEEAAAREWSVRGCRTKGSFASS